MKISFLPILLSLFFIACDDNNGYTIRGTYSNAPDNSKVYLVDLSPTSFITLDSSVVDRNGRFLFEGRQDTATVCFLFYTLPDGSETQTKIVLENGEIDVRIDGKSSKIGGTPTNDAFNKYNEEMDEFSKRAEPIFTSAPSPESLNNTQRDSIEKVFKAISDEGTELALNHIRLNINNPLGAFLLVTSEQMIEPSVLLPLIDSVPQIYRNARFELFLNRLQQTIEYRENALKTATGNKYINFELNNEEGAPVLFSTIIESNKYTLLDFWASWCSPCRQEMPEVKNIYDKYKSKGLEVVGLSLDTNIDKWKATIKSMSLNWIQLCNPNGGSQEVSRAYGVDFIPTTLIIDREGTIVARGSMNDELKNKIHELMK